MPSARTWEPVIGLEVHCQLKTATKIFCGCLNRFGDPPNTNVCPVCLGHPGTLPVLGHQAVELGLRAALALECRVHETSIFARKNYFYPDLAKGYQISQFEEPLATGGGVEIAPGRRIRLRRIHLEEDAGKLVHEGFSWSHDRSGVDYNRAGVPLAEIVSEPDLSSPEEAYAYLTQLKAILVYAGVSDCNMEEGSLRCDANISLRPAGSEGLGTRVEVKNLNSFRNVARALEHEVARQAEVLEDAEAVVQETRLWDAAQERTQPMRGKEESEDYRYFPEPDLPPLVVSAEWLEQVRASLPELPAARRGRFVETFGLPEYDAGVLTQSRDVADYFERAAAGGNPKAVSNWVMTEVLRELKGDERPVSECPVSPEALGELVALVDAGKVNNTTAKEVFAKMWASGERPGAIIEREGLGQVDDAEALRALVAEVIEANPKQVATYRGGKAATIGWFVGQVMKKTGGRANPQLVRSMLEEALAPGK